MEKQKQNKMTIEKLQALTYTVCLDEYEGELVYTCEYGNDIVEIYCEYDYEHERSWESGGDDGHVCMQGGDTTEYWPTDINKILYYEFVTGDETELTFSKEGKKELLNKLERLLE